MAWPGGEEPLVPSPQVAEDAKEPSPLADATRALLVFIKAHRTAGDSDLEAAVADVEAALEQYA